MLMLNLPRVSHRYAIVEQIGAGGMGVVYRALDRLSQSQVALKRISLQAALTGQAAPPKTLAGQAPVGKAPTVAGSEELLSARAVRGLKATAPAAQLAVSTPIPDSLRLALTQEFQTLASLRHPHIISVLEYGFDEQLQPFYTMELLSDATPLIAYTKQRSERERIELLLQLLQALAYLHRRGVLHRDIKPANVLVTPTGPHAKLLDFGLAVLRSQRERSAGEIAGTLGYLAPEVLLGVVASEASDLYSLGAVAYEVLTQRPLLPNLRTMQLVEATLNATIEWDLSSMSPALTPVLRRLLAFHPGERFPTADAAAQALAAAVGLASRRESAGVRESFLQAAEFIGRDEELKQLKQALYAALQGRGSAWLIGGESGVGKSRLVDELRPIALVSGARVLRGQAVRDGSEGFELFANLLRALSLEVPLSLLEAGVLKALLPDLPALLGRDIADPPMLDGPLARQRLQQVVCNTVIRSPQPLVILLEDLQWASSDSIELLSRLLTLLPERRLLLVGTYRNDERAELSALLPGAQVLRLPRLGTVAISRLSVSMLGPGGDRPELVDRLQQETEGNAFFLVEVMRALAEEAGGLAQVTSGPLPEVLVVGGVKAVLRRRFKQVPDAARRLLELTAVAGRQLDLHMLEKLEPQLPAWLQTCQDAGVLEVSEARWRFAHDKLREALLAELSADRRRELHAQVASTLEKLYADAEEGAYSATLEYHFREAGEYDKASVYALRAGDRANRLCLRPDARRHYGQGLQSLAQLDTTAPRQRRKVDLLLRLVQGSQLADAADFKLVRLNEAEAALTTLREAADSEPADGLRLARTLYLLGEVYHLKGELPRAIQYFRQVLPMAEEYKDRSLLALPLSKIGIGLTNQGHVREAEPELVEALLRLDADTEPFEWLLTCGYHARVRLARGHGIEGLRKLAECHAFAQRLDSPNAIGMAITSRALAYLILGDWPALCEAAREAIDPASRTGERFLLYLAHHELALGEMYQGNLQRAAEHYALGSALARQLGGQLLVSDQFAAHHAMLVLRQGDAAQAQELAMRRAELSREAGLLYSYGLAVRVRGLSRAALGLSTTEYMQESLDVFRQLGHKAEAAHTLLWWARLTHEQGNQNAARAYATQAYKAFTEYSFTYARASAKTLLDTLGAPEPSGLEQEVY